MSYFFLGLFALWCGWKCRGGWEEVKVNAKSYCAITEELQRAIDLVEQIKADVERFADEDNVVPIKKPLPPVNTQHKVYGNCRVTEHTDQ